jgi:hypothetical protein
MSQINVREITTKRAIRCSERNNPMAALTCPQVRRLQFAAVTEKVGCGARDFSAPGGLFPFYSPTIFFCEAKFATKIAKKTKIKLLICNELRI